MNDNESGYKIETPCSISHKPAWWTDSLEASWSRAKSEAIRDWHTIAQCQNNLEHRINGEAIALGHGARARYLKHQAWSRELEDLLKADWKEAGHRAECAWEKVCVAVRHGFEYTGAARSTAVRPAVNVAFLGGY